jgi:hypothetical protein
LFNQDNPDFWGDQNDPFRDESNPVPHDEVLWERAEQVRQDNQDGLRHFVELAIWEALDNPDLLKVLLALLWHWKAINPRWMAEASFKTVTNVRDIAESQAIMVFPCLDCGTELGVRNRRQQIRMQRALEEYCEDEAGNGVPYVLLCQTCREQRNDHAEQQSLLDNARQEALLKEYRKRPYGDRRQTQEWTVLKRQVHRRVPSIVTLGQRQPTCRDGEDCAPLPDQSLPKCKNPPMARPRQQFAETALETATSPHRGASSFLWWHTRTERRVWVSHPQVGP